MLEKKLVSFKFTNLNEKIKDKIKKEFYKYLSLINLENNFNDLSEVILKTVENANKSNLKRVHFIINELDIFSNNDYQMGILNFINELNNNYNYYLSMSEKLGFFIKLEFYLSDEFLFVTITRNNKALACEKNYFEDIMNYDDAINKKKKLLKEIIIDQVELKDAVDILKKIGLGSDYIKLSSDENSTRFIIILPLNLIDQEKLFSNDKSNIQDCIISPESNEFELFTACEEK